MLYIPVTILVKTYGFVGTANWILYIKNEWILSWFDEPTFMNLIYYFIIIITTNFINNY
jgi:hypothetical protein